MQKPAPEPTAYSHDPGIPFTASEPSPRHTASESAVPSSQNSENILSPSDAAGKTKDPVTPFKQWEEFVKYVEKSADKSLVSLLRNSVLKNISDECLVIGLQNTALYSEEKRLQLENWAKDYFHAGITISYEDSPEGLDESLNAKSEQERKQKESEQKKTAAKSPEVQRVLAVFPDSKITSINILEEKKDV